MKPPIVYYGGKVTIGERIASLLPPHQHYVEPFAGSLAVLLAKHPARMETVNDLHAELMTFWRVLRDRPVDLERVCALTPHSRAETAAALTDIPAEHPDRELEVARRIWVRLTQARSNGLQRVTGWRYYVNPGASYTSMPNYLEGYVGRMAAAAARLAKVSLECLPALDLIEKYGAQPGVLIYADPPYVLSARESSHYRHEMTDDEHRDLAAALSAAKSSVVLSGYDSPLYDELYDGWFRQEIAASAGNASEDRGRIEVLWSNRPFAGADLLFGDDLGGAA
jgi:DNA adenine methylase